jgi:hypothetical protein
MLIIASRKQMGKPDSGHVTSSQDSGRLDQGLFLFFIKKKCWLD